MRVVALVIALTKRAGGSFVDRNVAMPSSGNGRIIWTDVLVLAAVLAAMAIANTEWIFSRKDWIDTWMYFGYFRHYDFPAFLADNKKIARLPWILLGFLVNKAASPVASEYILHLGLLALGAIGLYRVTLMMFGRAVAVIIALTYITYMPAHADGGWDYHNTLAGPLYIFAYGALLSLTRDRLRPGWRGSVFGLLFALTLHTNIIFILLIPALIFRLAVELHYWPEDGTSIRRWLLRAFAGVTAGAASVTVLLGLINMAMGRDFLFFLPLARRSAFLLGHADAEKSWWLPWSDPWWYSQLHTTIPIVLIVIGLVLLVGLCIRLIRGQGFFPYSTVGRFVLTEFLIGLLTFVTGQTFGQPLLEPWYMAFPLMFPSFLALGSVVAGVLRTGTSKRSEPVPWNGVYTLVTAGTFLALFLGPFSLDRSAFEWLPRRWDNGVPIVITLGAIGLAYMVLRLRSDHLGGGSLLSAIGISLLVLGLADANVQWPDTPYIRRAYSLHDGCTARKAALSAIIEGDEALFPLFKSGKDHQIVYKDGETLGSADCPLDTAEIGKPLLAMGYGSPVHYWEMAGLGKLSDSDFRQAMSGAPFLAVLTNDRAYAASLFDRLRQNDHHWHISGERQIGGGEYAIRLELLSSEPDRSDWRAVAFSAAPENGAELRGTSVEIALASAPGTRSARLTPLAAMLQPNDAITMTLRVKSGEAAIGVLKQDGSSFVQQQIVTGEQVRQIVFQPADWKNLGPIVVDSTTGGGNLVILGIQDQTTHHAVPFTFAPENDAELQTTSLDVALPQAPWGYGVQLRLPSTRARAEGIALTLRVTEGEAGVGILNANGSDFIDRQIVTRSDSDRDIFFKVPDWHAVGPIVIQSTTGGGKVAISSVNLLSGDAQ